MYFKVNDHPNLIKDGHSKAVLNTDTSAVRRHEERFVRVNKEQTRDQQIQQLQQDVAQIHGMLAKILEKLGN